MKRVLFCLPVILLPLSMLAQEIRKEESDGSDVLFQKVKRVTMQLAPGADGEDPGHVMAQGRLINAGSRYVPDVQRWNSKYFSAVLPWLTKHWNRYTLR